MIELIIYIHIPFCVRKCLYCDFLSFPVSGAERREIGSYVNLLRQEIKSSAADYRDHRVVSVFWGGGTPSLLSGEEMGEVMEVIRACFHMAEEAEITVEMNPGTVDDGKLLLYRKAGINRVSIGLQSADEGELERIGRIHDYGTFLRTYESARQAGFGNINIDLMAALPGQSVASYKRSLISVAALLPEHISAYSLILEEGTPLYERRGEYLFPTEEEDRQMYLLTKNYLASCGYHRYEISNYAREGRECRHNKVYWQRGDYVGFGLGASSMVHNVRWSNPAGMEAYRLYVEGCMGRADRPMESMGAEYTEWADMGRAAGQDRHALSVEEQMEEYMFLGLRMMCGVGRQAFARQFGRRIEEVYGLVMDKLCRQGLLIFEGDCIKLTDRGIDVSNYAMAEFLLR